MKRTLYYKSILIILLIISSIRYYNAQNSELSQLSLLITLVTLLVTCIIYKLLLSKEKFLNNNYLKISSLFVVSFVLVHFFDYLAFVFGVKDNIIDVNLVDSKLINEAAICSLCVFIAYVIGYSSKSMLYTEKTIGNKYETGNLLDVLFLVFFLLFYIYMPKEYFKGGYGNLMNNGNFPIIAYLSQVFLQACQLGSSVDKIYRFRNSNHIHFISYIKSYSIYYYLTIIIYFMLVISSGDRGPLISMSIIYIASYYVINKKKLTLKYTMICVFLAVISLNILATLRAMDGDLSLAKIQEAQKYRTERYEDENVIFTSVSELSNVVRAYHAVYEFHDDVSSLYGLGILNQFFSFIPGLRFLLYPMLGVNENMLNSSYIATEQLGKNHGMGTTCIADVYLNFGFIGSVGFFYLFGIVIKRLDYILYRGNKPLFLLVLGLAFLSNGIYMGRATCFSPINVAIYAYLFVFLASRVYSKRLLN